MSVTLAQRELKKELVDIIRQRMEETGVRQSDLARDFRVSRAYIGAVLTLRTASLERLIEILEHLQMDVQISVEPRDG